MQNKVTIEDLDDFLEKWNKSNSSEKINEYLGLTEEQYYKWCDKIVEVKYIKIYTKINISFIFFLIQKLIKELTFIFSIIYKKIYFLILCAG